MKGAPVTNSFFEHDVDDINYEHELHNVKFLPIVSQGEERKFSECFGRIYGSIIEGM